LLQKGEKCALHPLFRPAVGFKLCILYNTAMNFSTEWLGQQLQDRFVRYARIYTTSDPHIDTSPSTPGQWELLKLLVQELKEIGIEDIDINDEGYLIARIPASPGCESVPVIGFLGHVDTSFDAPGEGVKPQIHDYEGGCITLNGGVVIDPEIDGELARRIGDTIITSDGTTLLGADDKAGIAEIVTAALWLVSHPEVEHGVIELIFTPDEETGKGMDRFPREKLRSTCCYTLDGDVEGVIETECFNAAKAQVVFDGIPIHPGTARGKLVNALSMAAGFISMLPRNESPAATDGRYGYYFAHELSGNTDSAKLEVLLRDFEVEEIERRKKALQAFADAVESQFPGGRVTIKATAQYANMRHSFDKEPRVVGLLEEAVRGAGLEPERRIIRGGTDGSRLSAMGIPTPNIFTGGHNYHSRSEWAALGVMISACQVIIHLSTLWRENA
jgi:tripeptide aminopeptidase